MNFFIAKNGATVIIKLSLFLNKLKCDNSGNILVMAAVILPVLVIGIGGVTDLSIIALEKKNLLAAARLSCDRATKVRLTSFPTVESRKNAGEQAFDNSYDGQTVTSVSREIDVQGRKVTVSAQATISLSFSKIAKLPAERVISEVVECDSIPGYPKINDIIYESNFKRAIDGSEFDLNHGVWGIIDPETVGWTMESDYQLDDSCGLEVQDWSKYLGFVGNFRHLPPGSESPTVLELDGFCNTTISKVFELHPGTYEFSLWYRGRAARTGDTNQIGVYLVTADPETLEADEWLSESNKKITMLDAEAGDWVRYGFAITTDEYSIYRFYLRGEGTSDSYGGLMSSLSVTYKGMD